VREADYQKWLAEQELVKKTFPADKIRQFNGEEKSLGFREPASWNCALNPLAKDCSDERKSKQHHATELGTWTHDYEDHFNKPMGYTEGSAHSIHSLIDEPIAVDDKTVWEHSEWAHKLSSWIELDKKNHVEYADWLIPQSEKDRIEAERRRIRKEEDRKEKEVAAKFEADQLKDWTERPFKERMKGLSNEGITKEWDTLIRNNKIKIRPTLTEKEQKILSCAGFCTKEPEHYNCADQEPCGPRWGL
jgi:hypothetical protein